MVKTVSKRLFCMLMIFSVANLKGQVPQVGQHSHPVLQNPQLVIFDDANKPAFENWTGVVNKLGKYGNDSKWEIYSTLNDELGMTHYRIRHYYKSVPAHLSMGILHTKQGVLGSLNGDFVSESQFAGKQVLSLDEARAKALQFLPAEKYYWQDPQQNLALQMATGVKDTSYFPLGALNYCPKDFNLAGIHRLAYRFDVLASEPLAGKSIWVDAETGEILASSNLILHADVKATAITKYSGTKTITVDSLSASSYRLRESGRGKGIETYDLKKGTTYSSAVDFTDVDKTWNNVNAAKDEVATDAHWGAEMTYDYFSGEHSRNSFDNNGAKILSYIHYSSNYNNAFWNGSVMTYGDGDGTRFTPLTALDVCGHEIAHAVTTNTAALVYSYESGALNESFSDVFGQSIEIWARPTQWNWKIGEDITPNGLGIRDMADPSGTNYSQPKFYKGNKWYTGTGDNGGVHYNSGVQNYWYYLLVQGASGTNEKGWNFNIGSLGLTKAGKIAYRNLSVYLTSSAQYADARTFSILSAADLYGQCSNEVIQVTNAWWVCGVGNKYDSGYVKADFMGDTLSCRSGVAMKFLNRSDNFKNSWWYFGDGNTSIATHPSNAYGAYGKYDVKLVVESCFKGFKDSVTKVQYVKIDSTYDICNAFVLPKSGSDSAIGCRGFVYDDGGEGNYGANKVVRFDLKLPGADSVRYRFRVLDFEAGFDSVAVYKNSVKASNRLGGFTGAVLPFAGAWKSEMADRLIFIQYTDPMVEGKGFKVEYVGVFKPVVASLGKDTVVCSGNAVDLVAAAAGGRNTGYSYSWTGPGLAGGGNAKNVTPASTQQYSVSVWDGCAITPTTVSKTVYVKPPLSVKIVQSDTAVCIGQTMYLTAKASGGDTAGYTYLWSNGLGTSALANIILTDTLAVSVTVSDGCSVVSASDTARLDTYLPLIMSVSNDTTICMGGDANLTANIYGGNRLHGGGAYVLGWSNGVKAGSIHVFPTITTKYYVIGSEGCSPNVLDSVTVTVRNPLYLSPVADTTLCHGQTYSVQLLDTGGLASSRKIVWDSASLSGNNVIVNPLAVGVTTYRVHVEDGCTVENDTIQFSVTRRTPLAGSIALSDTILCYGDATDVLMSANGGRTSTLTWKLDGVATTQTVQTDNPLSSKVYTLLVEDGCSIPFVDTIGVVVAPAKINLQLSAFDSVICAGSTSGYLDVTGTGGFAPLLYQWDDPAKQTSAKASGLGKGKYVLRVVDAQGCKDSMSLFVNEFASPMKPLKDTVIARGSMARLYAANGRQWRWSPKLFMMGSDTLWQVRVRPTDSLQYHLLALDSFGCLFRDSMWVRVVDPEVVRIPNIITPNGDGDNDVWDLYELFEYDQRGVNIYNRAGELVYSSGAYKNTWDGKDNQGMELPVGVYFYHLKHNKTGEEHRGFVQIMR
jgi:gliding motility-associated-like protein